MKILLIIGFSVGLILNLGVVFGGVVSSDKPRERIMEKRLVQSKDPSYRAVELVKNDPTLIDPTTGKRRSVENRMLDAKSAYYPKMTWRYEARQIDKDMYTVTQHVDNGKGETFTRIWTVNISANRVAPENSAARKLYY